MLFAFNMNFSPQVCDACDKYEVFQVIMPQADVLVVTTFRDFYLKTVHLFVANWRPALSACLNIFTL